MAAMLLAADLAFLECREHKPEGARELHPSDSEQFRPAPRTCHGVGGRLRMRRTDCDSDVLDNPFAVRRPRIDWLRL
jgi:hypothetical protein